MRLRSSVIGTTLILVAIAAAAQTAIDPSGHWEGTVSAASYGDLPLEIDLTNNADGTSTGHIISVDEGGLDLPVALVQNGANLVIDVPMVGSSYSGALNAAGTELIGTYKTGQGVELPLTFKRTPPN